MDVCEDDDGDYKVFPPPGPETSVGCGRCGKAKTIAPLTPSDSAGAPTSSSSSSAHGEAKEDQQPSPPSSLVHQVGEAKLDAAPAAQDGGAVTAASADAAAAGSSSEQGARCAAADIEAEEDDDNEDTDEEDDDDEYQEHYDRAERGRARCVKRSSGRRARTKKASTIGRPRGDVRHSHGSGDL